MFSEAPDRAQSQGSGTFPHSNKGRTITDLKEAHRKFHPREKGVASEGGKSHNPASKCAGPSTRRLAGPGFFSWPFPCCSAVSQPSGR